jgi:unsaturated rhamnogalacturonyl hydrolase
MSTPLDRTETTVNRELLRRVANTLPGLGYETWNFGDSVAFEAMIQASLDLQDPSYLGFARGWLRSWATRAQPYRRLDATAPGHSAVRIARATSDDRILTALSGLAAYLVERPTLGGAFETWSESPLMSPYGGHPLDPRGARLLARPPAGVFIDCLHFDPPFLTALGVETQSEELFVAGIEQALRYVELLQTGHGLFDHFVLRDEPTTYGSGWGRGQGWALLGLLDVIEEIGGSRAFTVPTQSDDLLAVAVNRLVAAMISFQRSDGHWDAVVSDPESGIESSTAAFMSFGFRRVWGLGLRDDAELRDSERRAREAVTRSVDSEGRLRDVSAAVMACTEPSHYSHVPRGFVVPWGQGPAYLALSGGFDD